MTSIFGSQYTTQKAQEYQRGVYQVLDRGSSEEARTEMQRELGKVKTILHNERKGTRAQLYVFLALHVVYVFLMELVLLTWVGW